MLNLFDRKISVVVMLLVLLPFFSFSQQKIQGLLTKLSKEHSDSARMACYLDIYYTDLYANPDSAAYYLNIGLKEFSDKNYIPGIAKITLQLGRLDVERGNLEAAKKREKDALKLLTDLDDKRDMAIAYNAIGEIEGRKGNLDTATAYFFTALKMSKESDNNDGIIMSYTNLGQISNMTNNLQDALDYYNKALALENDTLDVRAISNLYNNIGIIYGMMGDLEKAKEYIEKAKQKSDKNEYVDVYIYSLMNLAIVYQHKNDNKTALTYLDEALQLAQVKKLPTEEMQLLINKATIFRTMHIDQAADTMLQKALEIGKKTGNKSLLDDAYFNLVQLNKDRGDYKEMANLLEQEMAVKDSLGSVEKAKAIAGLQSVYELQESKSQVKEISLELAKQQFKKTAFGIATVALLVVVLLVVLYLQKTRHLYRLVSAQKEELQRANSTKDKLFSIIGHDLRGPMGNVTMLLDNITDEADAEEKKYYTNMLKTQSRAALGTLDTLLFWGMSQMRNNKTNHVVFDTSPIVEKNLELLDAIGKQKNILIKNNVPTSNMVSGDSAQFDFIVRNLLSNAIKYSPNGGHISIGVQPGGDPSYRLFAVTDEGIGINSERLTTLFDSFGDSTKGTGGEKGSGIGLMLCKEFVTANGGKIWATSETGKGSTFYFSFRAA